jgi:RNA polymerase sigma-70 factor (ECF subfamily)
MREAPEFSMLSSPTLHQSGVTESPAKEDLCDLDLVERAQADPQAFATLYLRYVDAVHRHCHWRLQNREAAEDATSQVFTQALAALPRFDGRRGTFRSWLFTIAHHVVIDQVRKSKRAVAINTSWEIPDREQSPEERAISAEQGRSLRAALDGLPPRERQVVELRLAGLTASEIAGVLGCRNNAVGAAQFRAINRLRTLMALEIEAEGHRDG